MPFVSISEYGTGETRLETLLNDLQKRVNRMRPPFEHDLMMTFGNTDVIEISRFSHYFHFAEMGSSSSQEFRRSVGSYCKRLPIKRHSCITPISDVLAEKGNEDYPFLAVVYLKMAIPPNLTLPTIPYTPLSHHLFDRFCSPNVSIWERSDAIFRRSIGQSSVKDFPRYPRITPLVGLDAVELTLVVRAACLEQLSALAWSVRNQSLEDFWPSEKHSAARARLMNLLQASGEDTRDIRNFLKTWNDSPLFAGSTSVLGLPIRKGKSDQDWRLERLHKPDRKAANAAFFTVRMSYATGTPGKPFRPFHNPPPLNFEDSKSEKERLKEQFQASGDQVLLMLFDRADQLQPPELVEVLAAPNKLVRPYLVRELRGHKEELANLGGHMERESLRTYTELAVRIEIPQKYISSTSNNPLFKQLREHLRKKRRMHYRRSEQFPRSWTWRWLKASGKIGIVYSATNKVLRIINTVLDHLDVDLEGFADLLPLTGHLIDIAEDSATTPADILRSIRILESITTARCRQVHPLRMPHVSLALEGNAGYRLARDGFIYLTESICMAVDSKAKLVVRDSSSGGISCTIGPVRWITLRVSTLTLHHPIHWLVIPALANSCLVHTTFGQIEERDPEASRLLRSVFNQTMGLEIEIGENLDRLLSRTRSYLKRESGQGLPSFFLDSLQQSLATLFADLCLWRSLMSPGQKTPDRARRLFWFLHGPGMIMVVQYLYGFKPLESKVIQSLIVRCILDSHILEHGAGHWFGALKADIRQLKVDAPSMKLEGDSKRPDKPLTARLQSLKEDLRIKDMAWMDAIDLLWESLVRVEQQAPKVLQVTGQWLEFLVKIHTDLFNLPEDHPYHLYTEYIDDLVELWGDKACPWLPFTVSHQKDKIEFRTFRLGDDAPYGPSLLRRGGVLVQNSSTDESSQEEYHRRTYHFVARLGEEARELRYQKILNYLDDSPADEANS